MPKRLDKQKLEGQCQEKYKLSLQDIEENSIEQLLAQPSPAFKETLKKMLTDNNEEIARLANLNKKILECLEGIDQQNQENLAGVPSKVSVISIMLFTFIFLIFRRHLAGPSCQRKFGFNCARICQ
jgi:hypothetical protein